jgi:hypothetical protein
MRKLRTPAVVLLVTAWSSLLLGQTTAGAQGSASNNTSISSGQSGTQVHNNAQTDASVQTGSSGKHRQAGTDAHTSTNTNSNASTGGTAGRTNEAGTVAGGTQIMAELTKGVDAKKAKPGDEVTAKTTHEAHFAEGTSIPKGTRLVGHVTQAQAREKGQSESMLGISFDRAVLKNGQSVPLHTSIQAIAAGTSSTAANVADEPVIAGSGSPAGMGSASAPAPRTGGLGGVTGTVGGITNGAAGTVANAGTVVGAAGSSTGSLGSRGTGALNTSSQGAIGLPGLTLSNAGSVAGNAVSSVSAAGTSAASAANASEGAVISSSTRNVKLDSGTQLLLSATESRQ